ncbi:MAG: putative FAD-dependent pyridine nucleotide-disulfide oxidoreductase [Gammaproteobacteria bacterium]|nr:putative FAD-dependent pyridine nucleotide-disulfide oxidoreductase [Gammaproteobacteria bacterium]
MTAHAPQLDEQPQDARPVSGPLPVTARPQVSPAPQTNPGREVIRSRQIIKARAPATSSPPAAPKTATPRPETAKPQRLTTVGVFSAAVVALLLIGLFLPTERYITPKRGIGYALGIMGGSMMLLLLLYSARKHVRWLKFLGPTVSWFRYHMLLGVLGPLCILYHANFGLGAANSNVALFSMLTVAGSGLIGRYIYARIHHGLYGSKLSLEELKAGADGLRAHSGAFSFLPELVNRLETAEKAILTAGPHLPLLGVAKLAVVALIVIKSRGQMRRYIRRGLRAAAKTSPTIAAERKRLRRTAFAYIDKRLTATRRVSGFQAYERLFSLWHALHIPLLFILIAAGIVHVIAVNVY